MARPMLRSLCPCPRLCPGLQSWVVGVIVGVILLLLPVPLFMLVRWRKRKNREARDLQAAEAEAARQRMHSKMMLRTGSKSFSLKPGGSAADIMVRRVVAWCGWGGWGWGGG